MATGRRLPYALDKIAYGGHHGTQSTVPARRGDIGEDAGDKRSPAQGEFSQPVKNYAAMLFPDTRGVRGHVVLGVTPAIDPHRPPDHGPKATSS